MAGEVYKLRWGILACGWIAGLFANDITINPASRGVNDVKHEVVAAASSTSENKARQLLQRCNALSAKAYGSYRGLVEDPDVDIVYIATPHSEHFQNVYMCLEAGKHVLCEKPFTVNAEQTRILIELATKKNLFLMEATWTRFFPLSTRVREMIKAGEIGTVLRVYADFSFGYDVQSTYGLKHRYTNMDLAGGCLLDIGFYSITWIFQTLYHTQNPSLQEEPEVLAMMSKFPPTGCDQLTSLLLSFPSAPGAQQQDRILPGNSCHGIATTSFVVTSDPDGTKEAGPSVRIQGTKGEIQVWGPPMRPERLKIFGRKTGDVTTLDDFDIPLGHGLFWQADECARCVRKGKCDSDVMPLKETLLVMKVMDKAREQGKLEYPARVESTTYLRERQDTDFKKEILKSRETKVLVS